MADVPGRITFVRALYDYTRIHTDELSFKKGDILAVSRQLDGGWWEGSLNGVTGWFPSNYVVRADDAACGGCQSNFDRPLVNHLHNFQEEILQHILEGEVRQANELSYLVSNFITQFEPLGRLPFLNKIFHMKELLIQAVDMHKAIAVALEKMKQSSEPKRVGKLFLDFAPTVNAIGCDYSKIHLYVITGLDKNADILDRHFSSRGVKFQLTRCKQQLSLIFDRLGRYPLLLKEMERYLENSHVDCEDIQKAMNVYGEITERCAILRKFKEYDIEILLSTINGWQGVSIDKLGDPVLTLRVTLTDVDRDSMDALPIIMSPTIDSGSDQLSVLVMFPACVLLLARTKQPDVYEFTMKLPLKCLTVLGCFETETDIDLIITGCSKDRESVHPCRISLRCTDQNARDLLVSTLTDLIHYQTHIEQSASGSRAALSTCDSMASQWERMSYHRHTEPNEGESSGTSTDKLSTPVSERTQSSLSQQTNAVHISVTTGSSASPRDLSPPTISTGNSAKSREINPTAQTNSCSSVPPSSEAPTVNSTPAHRSSSPSLPAGLQYLPHQITTNAHVRLFDQSDSRENEQPLPTSVVQCLRLDGPLDVNHNTYWCSRVCSYMNLGGPSAPQVSSFGPKVDADLSGAGRMHSPKGDGVKELRRKKSDPLQFICGHRQKSAINVDEVLHSVVKLHDNERRTADAARVLQVVEAYCASAWTQLSCRALDSCSSTSRDPDKHVCSTGISPTESKTLLQQFTSPTLISSVHQDTDPKRHSKVVLTPAELKSSARTSLSASVFVRGVAKRSGSKNKADLVHAQTASVSRSSPLPLAAHSSAPTESVVQNMSPPPVILPTRSGRRL
ncbi:hypothetical protein EG68_02913 [Paragonimus skrjabini miyazakii]|uniref:Rho guanine nucleotide exchange factor 7 n=1 Tax=Paragonimus skrjabini miyazakii TaxID=59628 RepID=A0A8S9YZE5_9TREM|nr:hypothetical protein EG68_02913 [Paragonimus skrjabini miyazakii]